MSPRHLFPLGVEAPAAPTPDIVVTSSVPLTVTRRKDDKTSKLELAKSVTAVVNGEVVK